jgi:hypothetical protein
MRDGAAENYLLCYKVDAELTLQKHCKNYLALGRWWR